jgi:hypothetical protein
MNNEIVTTDYIEEAPAEIKAVNNVSVNSVVENTKKNQSVRDIP